MKFRVLAAVTFAGLAIWLSSRPIETPVDDVVSLTAAHAERKSPIAIQATVHVQAIGHAPPRTPAALAKARADNVVDYEVIDGLAIAYGDVMIGQASGGANGDRGHHEMPAPQLWPTQTIPYYVSPDLPRPERVLQALAYFQKTTVVRFVPFSGSGDGIGFEPGNEHCFATLGRMGGLQPVKLAEGCGTGEIIHEIMHVLGFIHEQSRPDRDRSIEVLWDNIDDRYRDQYALAPDALAGPLRDSPFDFRSAMLYRPDTFAKRTGVDTMRSLEQGRMISPMTDGLSVEDVRRVNRLFGT